MQRSSFLTAVVLHRGGAERHNAEKAEEAQPLPRKNDTEDEGQDQRQCQVSRRERSPDAETPLTHTPVTVVIPERRAAVGHQQELSDEDQDS